MKLMADRVAVIRDIAVEPMGTLYRPNEPPLNTGKVVAIGEGRVTERGIFIATEVQVGDRIMFAPKAGVPVKLDGEDVLMMREIEVMLIFGKGDSV
jgi:co-chaperonin GroES (HSP10)